MEEPEEDFDVNEDPEFDDEIYIPDQWIKGFNEGYYIAKYMPELSLLLSTAQAESQHLKGLKSGRSQYLVDKTKERLHWLDQRPKDNRLVAEQDKGEFPR